MKHPTGLKASAPVDGAFADVHDVDTHVDVARGVTRFVIQHHTACAVAVLGLALFNLTFRLGQEYVSEWDESLYGISAWEAAAHGSWIGTTFLGALDYYNTKPPLLVWLMALAFKTLGPSLWSLRLVSVLSAWTTIAVLQRWVHRHFGAMAALLSSLVLSTTFGFVYVHSGRSAATDAPFTLVVLLTVVILSAEQEQPSRRIWIGPVLAAAFLLRGMGVLMPMAIAAATYGRRWRHTPRAWPATLGALLLFVGPVAAWMTARYQVDGWAFFKPMVMYDFVARTAGAIEGHTGDAWYYPKVLLNNHYDWLLAGGVAWILFRRPWEEPRAVSPPSREREGLRILGSWAVVTLAIPGLMQTKVPWYLNTFYPVFAVAIAISVARAVSVAAAGTSRAWRFATLCGACLVALGVAEGKLLWYSYHYRDLRLSQQALLLAARPELRGHRVYLMRYTRADHFVAEAIVGATPERFVDYPRFLRESREGDYLLTAAQWCTSDTAYVLFNSRGCLCRRTAESVRERRTATVYRPRVRRGPGASRHRHRRVPVQSLFAAAKRFDTGPVTVDDVIGHAEGTPSARPHVPDIEARLNG